MSALDQQVAEKRRVIENRLRDSEGYIHINDVDALDALLTTHRRQVESALLAEWSAGEGDAYCLANGHTHAMRGEEVVCSLRFQRDQARARLSTAEARVQRLEELVRWVVPLLRDAVQPINAEFLGRIWSDAARKRLAEALALLPEETTNE